MKGAATRALAILLLQACVPAHLSGYMPVGPGRLERDHCSSIEDILSFKIEGDVELIAWVPKNATPTDLRVSVVVPAASVARLRSPEFVLESPDWPEPRRLRAVAIASPGTSADRPAAAEMRGERHVNYTAGGSMSSVVDASRFWMKFDKAAHPSAGPLRPSAFTLRFPELDINGRTHRPQPLLFEAYSRVGMAGFCN